MVSIFLSGCTLIGKLPSTLMHVVIMPLLKCTSKDRADVNNYRPITIATYLSKVLEQVLLSRLSRYCRVHTANLVSSKQMGHKLPYFHSNKLWIFTVIRTHMYTCAFLMQKKALDRVNNWTLAKKLLDRNVLLHIVKLSMYCIVYIEQEFIV